MPLNRAAYQNAKGASSFVVNDAPYPKVTNGHIIIRAAAVAMNPIDWLIQARGDMMYSHLKYPTPLGFDVAGEVVEVGQGSRFQVGDRVVGLARGNEEKVNDAAQAAFQNYVLMKEEFTSKLPPGTSCEDAAVLPLSLATASTALFAADQLGLELPTVPARKPASPKPVVIIWGGSTSVGCSAVQLAVAAGCEVLSTSSPKNYDLLRRLGASRVFDYNSPSVDQDMIAALQGRTTAGAVAIGTGAVEHCMSIVSKARGKKFVAMVSFPMSPSDIIDRSLLRIVPNLAWWFASNKFHGAVQGVKFGLTTVNSDVCKYIFTNYVSAALEAGSQVPAPAAHVVGHGLENIQGALETQKKGVSAKKIVVTL
ncbi:putative alcohol dehydrogenase [Xylariales sp. PMI_506]|nr:putative alcohol dehydrogenase [Xylariales sp. PMI_506]